MSYSVKYYGVRGSTPTSGKGFLKYGGSTTCVHIQKNNTHIIIDAGTGIRQLGLDLLGNGFTSPGGKAHIFFSHTHWDHIQGLPFFIPIYMPQNRLHIYGETKSIPIFGEFDKRQWSIQDVLAMQQNFMYFPVATNDLASELEYTEIKAGQKIQVDEISVSTIQLKHPNSSIGFRFESNNKTYVYCTDVEHSEELIPRIIEFAKGANILAYDCQYTPEEYEKSKIGWGHSTFEYAIKIAKEAGVPEIHMIHHDPVHIDSDLEKIEARAKALFENIKMIPEGYQFTL